jgi:hypothetical protein
MFDHKHYVPILRWKRAEWIALRNLFDRDRAAMTPLVELVPRSFGPNSRGEVPSPETVLSNAAAEIEKSWGRGRIFVDLWLLSPMPTFPGGVHPLTFLGDQARTRRLSVVPVTGVGRLPAYQAAVAAIASSEPCGVCIRAHPSEFETGDFPVRLKSLMGSLCVQEKDVDLILDYQVLGAAAISLALVESRIPNITAWRTFTVASGAFPPDLQQFPIGQRVLRRSDWLLWLGHVTSGEKSSRLPSYSDYTIQHGRFIEPPERANFSASIRYTASRDWVIMRGEGVYHDGSPGYAQWPANAQLLCARPEFCGPAYSYGDHYIDEKSRNPASTGGAETWLREGINHHLTFAVRQIASLPDS